MKLRNKIELLKAPENRVIADSSFKESPTRVRH